MSEDGLELGLFSVSLAVKDLETSEAFYETLGFTRTGGGDDYAIMVNGTAVIGLFQGMFDGNILTFNPGLSESKEQLTAFTDVRDIQARLREAGVELTSDTDPAGTGPTHIAFVDPDGNAVLIDQFFPRPGSAAE